MNIIQAEQLTAEHDRMRAKRFAHAERLGLYRQDSRRQNLIVRLRGVHLFTRIGNQLGVKLVHLGYSLQAATAR